MSTSTGFGALVLIFQDGHGLIHGLNEAEEAEAMTILEDEHQRAGARADRQQIQSDGLDRDNHRPKPDEERDDSPEQNQRRHKTEPPPHGVEVVRTGSRQAAHKHASSVDSGKP